MARTYTTPELCEMYGVTRRGIYHLIHNNKLHPEFVEGRYVFHTDDLLAFDLSGHKFRKNFKRRWKKKPEQEKGDAHGQPEQA